MPRLSLYESEQQNKLTLILKSVVTNIVMHEPSEDMDYEPDVLKFKELWKDMKSTKEKNRQSPKKENQRTHINSCYSKDARKKGSEPKRRKTVMSKADQHKQCRNLKDKASEVIQIQTKPIQENLNTFYQRETRDNLQQTGITGLCGNEQLRRMVADKDREIALLRVHNSRNEDRIRALQNQLEKKQTEIQDGKAKERGLLERINSLENKGLQFDYGKVEYQNSKADSLRLLKMLKNTSEYSTFADFAIEDNGIRFLHGANKKHKSKLDEAKKKSGVLHFCTCNKEFIPESGFWVPEKVYSFGTQFIKQVKGELTKPQLQLLLYELNRIWREREKRIVNSLTADKAHEVRKCKRKISNLNQKYSKYRDEA